MAPLPPELARYDEWVPARDAAGEPARTSVSPRTDRPRHRGGRWTSRLRARLSTLRWSLRATTATAIGGALAASIAAPAAVEAGGPGALGLWAATAGATAMAGTGAGLALRIALIGPTEARRRALTAEIWRRHTRRLLSGVVIDAPGQTRWQLATAFTRLEDLLGGVPWDERDRLLDEARIVAVTASRLLLDAERLGQARLRLFPGARFGRLDLTADDSEVPGAGAAYRRLLDDAERQLGDLVAALEARTSVASSAATELAPTEARRLHALVSLAALEADPATRGPEPAIVRAADRLRAEAAAEQELEP